jgi:PAS domain S-box-containing protein
MVAIWAVSYAFEFATGQLTLKILWSKISYLGIAFLPLFYFLFSTAFSQKNHLIKPINLFFLSVIPVITIIMVFTNDLHGLVWRDIQHDKAANLAIYKHGVWFWIFYSYTFILLLSGLYQLVSSIQKFTSYYKSQITILILGSAIPIIGNIIYVSGLNPFPGFDWTPVAFVATGMFVLFGVFRHNMFRLLPQAKQKLIDTMNEGVAVVNQDGYIEEINPAFQRIFNFKLKKLIKKNINEVFHAYPELHAGLSQNKENMLTLQIGKNGMEHFYQACITPVYDNLKQITGKLLTLTDITALQQAEIRLKGTNRQLNEEIQKNEKLIEELDAFAHTVAHDLKNSLGSIYSSSQVIMDSIDDENKEFIRELSKLINDSAERTIRITNEMLKMATAGHQEIDVVPFGMQAVFNRALEQVANLTNQFDASITVPDEWHNSLGYAPWVEEVWSNYLSNAIKYGGTPPQIQVGCERKQNKVKYWIKDNGDGILQQHHHKLFKKHTRLEPDKAFGYGLGLSIVKRIVEKLGGTVGLESTGKPGEGALFYFELPAS